MSKDIIELQAKEKQSDQLLFLQRAREVREKADEEKRKAQIANASAKHDTSMKFVTAMKGNDRTLALNELRKLFKYE
jgi:hypothetical protein